MNGNHLQVHSLFERISLVEQDEGAWKALANLTPLIRVVRRHHVHPDSAGRLRLKVISVNRTSFLSNDDDVVQYYCHHAAGHPSAPISSDCSSIQGTTTLCQNKLCRLGSRFENANFSFIGDVLAAFRVPFNIDNFKQFMEKSGVHMLEMIVWLRTNLSYHTPVILIKDIGYTVIWEQCH